MISGMVHAVLLCPAALAPRLELWTALGWSAAPEATGEKLAALLRLAPEQPGYCEMVRLLAFVDTALAQFWLRRGRDDS